MRKDISQEQLQEALEQSKSAAEICRRLQCSGSVLDRLCKLYGFHYEINRGGKGLSKRKKYKTPEDAFKLGNVPSGTLISYLKQEREWKCECCGLTTWRGEKLPLEVHHMDGNRLNNVRTNLQILCPNCHALTENWRSRNTKGYSSNSLKVSDEDLLKALKETPSIREALSRVGLAGGANYYRAYKLLADKPS